MNTAYPNFLKKNTLLIITFLITLILCKTLKP